MAKTYNLRYTEQREKLYRDIVAEWDKIHSELGAEKASGLRMLFDIGETSRKEDRMQSVQSLERTGAGKFRGIRTFKDLGLLRRFLTFGDGPNSGVSFRRDSMQGPSSVRLVSYQHRGARIVGETVHTKFNLINEKD